MVSLLVGTRTMCPACCHSGECWNTISMFPDILLLRNHVFWRGAHIMCTKRHDRQSITAVLRRLHWLPVKWRINYKIVVLVFLALHGLAPAYVSTFITPYEPRRALRSTGKALLCVPRHNLERYGRRSIYCAGPVLWNSLPEDMRLADSLNSFKSHLKTHYFKLAYNL